MSSTSITGRRHMQNTQKPLTDIDSDHGASPLNQRILPEVLIQVFLYACPAPSLDEVRLVSSRNHRRRLLNLTHVCGTWREIAHNTPKLWSVIGIELLDTAPREYEWVEFCIDKSSKASGLSIFLAVRNAPRSHPNWQKAVNRKALGNFFSAVSLDLRLRSIIQHSDRWEHLSIILSQPPIVGYLLHTFASHIVDEPKLPQLRSLSVSLSPIASDCNVWGLHRPAHEVDALQSAPHLKRVRYTTEEVAWAPMEGMPWYSPIPLPLIQIHLLLEILISCPELRHLHAGSLMQDDMDPESQTYLQSVRLEHLISLSISGEGHSVASFLDSIQVPSLERLAIAVDYNAWPQFAIQEFLSGVSSTLRTLEIGESLLPRDSLVPCLSRTPKLEVFSITQSSFDRRLAEDLLRTLTDTGTSASASSSTTLDMALLPDLKSFRLTLSRARISEEINLALFHKMIMSRVGENRAVRLQSASICITSDIHRGQPRFKPGGLAQLAEMKKNGFCVDIFYKVGKVSRRIL
ncbi:hypothetical protein WG66_015893 [Moniliophthora roreri]|nr:hypothetical protein WG66_015893 [Moniliophthora roreri]